MVNSLDSIFRTSRAFAVALLAIVIVSGCKKSPPAPEISASIATTQWLDRKFGFVADHEASRFMNKMMQRLGDAVYRASLESGASPDESERFKNFPWQVFVLNADQPNAFSASGGVLFVTRGLFVELETEASFAAVIAHEMAHELMGHLTEIADRQDGQNGPGIAFTLQHEIEADAVSVALMRLARYNPREILQAISAMAKSRSRSADPNHQGWAAERSSKLNQLLSREIPVLPATTNSRDYNVIRDRMRNHAISTTR